MSLIASKPQVSSSPAASVVAITPNDGTDLAGGPTRGIYVGGAGDIVVVTRNGETTTITGALAGTVLPVQVLRVKATLTTATALLALY